MRQPTPVPEAIAHRGVRDRYPENSLPAFVAALDDGADAIELDVHTTRDGVVVVHHDPRLPTATTSPMAGRAISAIDYPDLANFELAPGVGIPTLEETLRAVIPRANIYVEIKAPDIEAAVGETLRQVPAASEMCAVHSFDHRIVRRFSLLAPSVPTGILMVAYVIDSVALLESAGARDLWQACDFVDAELVASVHAARRRAIAWTCNDAAEWHRLRQLGVDGICTDRVASLVSWLRSE